MAFSDSCLVQRYKRRNSGDQVLYHKDDDSSIIFYYDLCLENMVWRTEERCTLVVDSRD